MTNDLDPLDPKRKLLDALGGLPGGTAVDPAVDPAQSTEPIGGKPELPVSPAAPPAAAMPNYRDNSRVTLPGWDSTRTDNSGKYEFGRFAQSKGGHVTADDVRAFVAQNPNEWEIDPHSSPGDPHIRQKQDWLNNPANGDSKAGQTSIYQDVIGDSGGQNLAQFSNVEGDPALGYAAPGAPAPSSAAAGGAGVPTSLDGLLTGGGSLEKILAALQQLSGPRTNAQALLAALGGK